MKRDISEWFGVVLLLLGGLTLSAPFVLQAIDSAGQTASAEAAALPTPDGRRMIEEAKAYNEGLSARPQSVLGEAGDTFSGTSYSGGDKEYRGLLDADGGGTMGAVRYPRLRQPGGRPVPRACTSACRCATARTPPRWKGRRGTSTGRRCRWEANPRTRSSRPTGVWRTG